MKRIKILLALIVAALLVVLGRLVWLQGVRGPDYTRKAADLMNRIELQEARRGRILDRFGRQPGAAILAYDEPCWDLALDYRLLVLAAVDRKWDIQVDPKFLEKKVNRWKTEQIRQIVRATGVSTAEAEKTFAARLENTITWAARAAEVVQVDLQGGIQRTIGRVEHIRDMLRRHEKGPPREEEWSHPIVRGLDSSMQAEIASQLPGMVGAQLRESTRRCYPHKDVACHVIGRSGPVDAAEQNRHNLHDDSDLIDRIRHGDYMDGDTIGKNGAELLFEDVLRGRRGFRKFNRITGQVLDELEPQEGRDIRLTIDLALQQQIASLYADNKYTGAAVVIHVPTGELLALVSYPTHDLNAFGREFEALSRDVIRLPMRHRAVSQLYPSGSSIKPFIALAGLSSGVIKESTEFVCYHRLFANVPGRWKCLGQHNEIDVVRAIKASCNVFFYHTGELLGVGGVRDWFGRAGLMDKPGTRLPDEKPGYIPGAKRGENTPGVARMMGIGQMLGITPLHMANVMATIARGGEFVSPKICLDDPTPQVRRSLPVTAEALRLVREGMAQVVNEPRGTAYTVFQQGEPLKVSVAGKTGTAEGTPQRIDSNGDGRIDRRDEIVRQGNMAWFVGYAPKDNPTIAFAVVVEYVPEHGNIIAGPVARELVRAAQDRHALP